MTLYDFDYDNTGAVLNYVNNLHRGAQVFKATASYKAKALSFMVSENAGQSAGTITYELWSVNGSYEPSSLLTSASVTDTGSNVSGAPGDWLDMALSTPYTITKDTYYALVCKISSNPTSPGTLDYFHLHGSNPGSHGGANEEFIYSTDSGATWTHFADRDTTFRIIAENGDLFPFFWGF